MNNHIPIHSFTVGFSATDCERYEIKRIPNKVRQSKAGSHDLGGVRSICSEYIFGGLRTKCAAPLRLAAALQFNLQCHLGEARMQVATTPTVTVRVQEQDVEWEVKPTRAYAASSWIGTFYYALITRAKKTLHKIGELPYYLKFVHERESSPLDQAYYQFMIGLIEGDEAEALLRLGQAETYLADFPPTWGPIFRIHFPLWRPILENNQAAFDEQLEASLRAHNSYWGQPTATEPLWMNFQDGHYNVPLTAMMAFAYDRGLQVNWTSDYTPIELVRGDFKTDWDAEPAFFFP
jgi:hypothetical protein